MIKLKKLLAGVLGAAMVLSSMSLTAFAAQTTTPATIDTSKKGSLTIHKYEYNGTEKINGTGSENDNVPDGANPLAGAEFTIYKVVDEAGMTAYYNTNPTALPDVSTYADMTTKTIKSKYETKALPPVTTDKEGIAKFESLELGFYVVVETEKPDSVTTAMNPFIVSIPMTTVDGADWLYDVHVYPKNSTGYGKVELKKTAADGITALSGVEFELYKRKSDGNYTKITKKAGASGDNTGENLTLTTNASGIITVEGLTKGDYYFVEKSLGSNGGYILDLATKYEFTVNEDKTVTYGQTIDANVTIPVKNDKPDFDKQVKDANGTWKNDADYSVGDAVPYRLTIDVPFNITSLKTFTVTDAPTHLKDNVDSIKLYYGDTAAAAQAAAEAGTESAKVAAAAYNTPAVNDTNGFKIEFNPSAMDAYKGKYIVVSYNATLLSDAVTTTAGNPNTATLIYSNKIKADSTKPDGDNDKNQIKDNAVVYTFELKINKTGEDNAKLSGVVFDLYKEVAAGTTGAATAAEVKEAGLDTTKTWKKLTTLTTDDGAASMSGLANGTYYLVETKTNAGYNLLKAPVAVTLNISYKTSMTETWSWENGVLVKHEITSLKTTFTGGDATATNAGYVTQTIVNKKGFTLPTTGGMGSIIFIVGGIAIALAGLMIILASRKKTAAN